MRRVPFNVVDEAVHVLDTYAEPWSVQMELRVSNGLDEARLRSAVGEALARHPMARARKAATARRSERNYCWEITPAPDLDPLRVVECPDDDALAVARAELQSHSVSLAQSPPLRVLLARHPGGDAVMLNVNHAAIDGFGSLRLLRSVSRAYAGDPDPVPDIEPLDARDLEAVVGTEDSRTKARRAALLAEKLRDLVVAPARIAPERGSERHGYGFHHVRLSRDKSAALKNLGLPGTVNDALLAGLHLAIAAWNGDKGAPPRRIGVMVPANMRPAEWREEIVGNLLLPLRVSTHPGDRAGPETALRAVTAQTRRIKEQGTAAALIELLGRSSTLPLQAKEATPALFSLTDNRLVDTALLSNLGQLDHDPPSFGREAPDAVEAWFSAPARMPLGLSLGVATLRERLHLSFRYRHLLWDARAASCFAGHYLSALEQLLRCDRES